MAEKGRAAGTSSQRKYDELVRSWRRRNRRVFAILGAVCAAILVASLVAASLWPSRGWLWGFLGGGSSALFLIARLSPPGWIEHWQFGAWGEQATAKALRPLEKEGWVILHDLPAGRGNVDHVAVGPGGVYLLDSKRLGGVATVHEQGMTVRRIDDPDLRYEHTGTGHLLALARGTHERVLAHTRIKVWVAPVMVMWCDFPQRVVEGRCHYLHGEELAAWLRARPQTVASGRVPQLAEAVRVAWEAESAPT